MLHIAIILFGALAGAIFIPILEAIVDKLLSTPGALLGGCVFIVYLAGVGTFLFSR